MARDARRGSTRPCWSASAPRSTSTPASSRRRPRGCSGSGSSGLFRLAQEPRRLWRRYLALQPALRGRLRAPVRAPPPAGAPLASSADALRRLRHRPRPRRPAARAQLRRRRPARARRRQGRRRGSRRVRERRMPFKEPGTEELLAARADARRSPTRAADAAAGRRDRAHARHAGAARTSRSTWATSARCSTTCCRCCAPATLLVLRSTVAPGHDRVRRRLPGEAARLPGRRGPVRRPRARADRRRPLHGGDRHAAVHRRRRRRGVGRARGASCSSALGAPIVQTTPVQAELAKIWTNILRYATFALPEPADDGLRALRRERVRGHRPDQPRLSARRDGAAGPHRGHVPAQGLRVLRGALERARACCWPSRACTRPCRCSWSTASSGGSAGRCASARSPCSGWPSSATPTTSATRSRTS